MRTNQVDYSGQLIQLSLLIIRSLPAWLSVEHSTLHWGDIRIFPLYSLDGHNCALLLETIRPFRRRASSLTGFTLCEPGELPPEISVDSGDIVI